MPRLAQLACVTVACLALLGCPLPPRVESQEAYEAKPGGPTVDHSTFDAVLQRHVDAEGWVDYAALAADSSQLDAYLGRLAALDLESLGRDERLATLINAYNAFTLRLILDHWPLESIRDIPSDERWKGRTWLLGGERLTLDQIEHEEIRPKFREPRIHFAVNCASIGCPPLRPEAFVGARLEAQLEEQTRMVHADPRWLSHDAARGEVALTKIYSWFGDDFEQSPAGSVLAFVARYDPRVAEALAADQEPSVDWLDWDWTLNDVSKR
ncbi:MAG: DUF547 domain-containing protein [Acidobacteriota bacterium]